MLSRFSELEDLFIMRVTKLSDLSVLKDLLNLRTLRLCWMRNVTALPNLARLERLESVELDTMKGLADLTWLAAAPALRRLWVTTMPQLTAEDFRCLIDHPRLAELSVATGKSTVNEKVRLMFPNIAK
jgi:hypothetical protein